MAKPDWCHQSFKKTGNKLSSGIVDTGSPFHKKAPVGYADGGIVDSIKDGFNSVKDWFSKESSGQHRVEREKEAMAAADRAVDGSSTISGNSGTTTWERLKAGNIDDPQSEAYHRWGAGAKATSERADARFKKAMDENDALMELHRKADAYDRSMASKKDATPAPAPATAAAPAAPKQDEKAASPAATTPAPAATTPAPAAKKDSKASKPSVTKVLHDKAVVAFDKYNDLVATGKLKEAAALRAKSDPSIVGDWNRISPAQAKAMAKEGGSIEADMARNDRSDAAQAKKDQPRLAKESKAYVDRLNTEAFGKASAPAKPAVKTKKDDKAAAPAAATPASAATPSAPKDKPSKFGPFESAEDVGTWQKNYNASLSAADAKKRISEDSKYGSKTKAAMESIKPKERAAAPATPAATPAPAKPASPAAAPAPAAQKPDNRSAWQKAQDKSFDDMVARSDRRTIEEDVAYRKRMAAEKAKRDQAYVTKLNREAFPPINKPAQKEAPIAKHLRDVGKFLEESKARGDAERLKREKAKKAEQKKGQKKPLINLPKTIYTPKP